MLNLAIHRIERIDVGDVRTLDSSYGIFSTRAIHVSYRDGAGTQRMQTIDLYADEPEKLSVILPEEVMYENS